MSCCGKIIEVAGKVGRIAEGHIGLWLERCFDLRGFKCGEADTRQRVCFTCEKQTWLSRAEYSEFVMLNPAAFAENFLDLSKLPELPKSEKGSHLFCQVCKCYLPAKVRVEAEKCPLGKW